MAQVYKQCKLKKGNLHTTTYLPIEFAIKGRVVKIRPDAQSEWQDGWKVDVVYNGTTTDRYLNLIRKIRKQMPI